ncbi:glycosyltransferase family 4 protein [Paludibaculum fermentans]|uniref:Glycosyltransferase family 4 protein n=1 Tax=Paludibaculum fermentans TaxID=1473598 RepID=A0A7S7NM23_PALFE|nr:glycosyltransferase family 1 protein [Paludibaculum fermentans]QOY86101.1 glycosyltransferase family 4 protein [Paludibaculum fermentans]
MNIALDATYSLGENLSGVGVYSREILFGLAASHPQQRFAWCYRLHRYLRGRREALPLNVAARPLLDTLPLFRNGLFHGLNQRLPHRSAGPAVCTFHDLFVLTSDYSSPDFRARFAGQARHAAQRADLIICVSRFTANQVRDLLGVPEARLRVIPHGTHLPPAAPAARRGPVILHVGAVQLRKNLLRLVSAFERNAPPPWQLVLAGSDGYGAAAIHERIAASPARDRISVTGWVDNQRLDALYASAAIFAFPSLDEGFGIPVLEAMAHGLPVISSNRSALPEACGDAALLVDPTQEEEIGLALRRLIQDEDLRNMLVRLGHSRAAEFSWQRAVDLTWKVYQELRA